MSEAAPVVPAAVTGVDVVILDMDGVIRHWDLDAFARLALDHGLSRSDLAAIAFQDDLLHGAMVGTHDADQWAALIGERAAAAHGVDATVLAKGFAGLPWRIDQAVVTLAAELRAAGRVRVALFSNASTRLEADLVACDLAGAFDEVFNSSRLGQVKPDPEAFRSVVAALDADPGRCLFVDDTPANVAGAGRAGLQALVFNGAEDLRAALGSLGLLA